MPIKPFLLLSLCLAVSFCTSSAAEGMRVQYLEQEITQAAKMDFSNYRLYPFAITSHQQFSLHFLEQENVKGEIRINWIDLSKNELAYPTYDISEFVKVRVVDSQTNTTVQQRKFHFQTGINFIAEPNHRYRLIFTDYGHQNKMIELSISRVESCRLAQLAANNLTSTAERAIWMGKEVESQLSDLVLQTECSGRSIKNIYEYIMSSLSQYLIFSAWEICLVCLLMAAQVLFFRNLIKNYEMFI